MLLLPARVLDLTYLPEPLEDGLLAACACRMVIWEYDSGLHINVHDLREHHCVRYAPDTQTEPLYPEGYFDTLERVLCAAVGVALEGEPPDLGALPTKSSLPEAGGGGFWT